MDAAAIEARINRYVAFFLRHWVAAASIWAGLIVAGAIVTPLLAANGFDTLSWAMYKLYRVICPQQPDHSWFIAGHKMGFEQRDTAMFAAGAIAGPLYLLAKRLGFGGISGRTMLVFQIPILIDVFSQVFGFRDSDGFWRSLTGTIAVWAIVAWIYPRLDADFQRAHQRIQDTLHRKETGAATIEPDLVRQQ